LSTADALDVALAQGFRGFGHPDEPFDEELFSLAVEEYTRGITRAFFERNAELVAGSSDGLVPSLMPWLEGRRMPGVAWDPAFGDLYRTLKSGDDDAQLRVAAAIGLHVGSSGLPGTWEVRLAAPATSMRWGRHLLPPASVVRVNSDGRNAHIELKGEGGTQTVALARSGNGWEGDGAYAIPRVQAHGVDLVLLPHAALELKGLEHLRDDAVDDVDGRIVSVFEEAVDIIRRHTPEYLPWVQRPLHHVFLLRPKGHTIVSGSVQDYPGLIHLTAHAEPLPVAELLVHEATHQYMNAALKVEPVDDGTDAATYWSPPVERERPLQMILAAYHAFANVLLFYRGCARTGLADQVECERQELLLGDWLEQLERPLLGNPSLTACGHGLFDPLHERV
jgi:HEXXH motif-containing protein